MNILITGKSGYLARALIAHLSKTHTVTSIGREDLQLSNRQSVREWFKGKSFDVVLHTAISGGNRMKKEQDDTLSINLKMFFNLLEHKNKYAKFINFGSVAEFHLYESDYGLSKNIISHYIDKEKNCYNLRICGLFDHNDIDTRFIKSNIKNYINRLPQIIHKNKYMDFIYMSDLISIVEFYIENKDVPKTTDCVYTSKYHLYEIAGFINNLDNYCVPVVIEDNVEDIPYIGARCMLPITLTGLQSGIQQTYQKLLELEN